MKQELQEQLFKKYPEIFFEKDLSMKETCMCWGIECGDGWYNIIDTLCRLIDNDLKQNKNDIERYTERIKDPNSTQETKEHYITQLEKAVTWPKKIHATQIKEKYGTLRFYTDYYHPEIDAYISFAETMSEVTCEVCGSPGEINSGGWLSVRCKEHRQ